MISRRDTVVLAILVAVALPAAPLAAAGPLPADPTGLAPLACDDGLDNDGDGLVDARRAHGDPGCASPLDASEHADHLACDDGADNDGDGRVDYANGPLGDAGCTSPLDASEEGEPPLRVPSVERPACADGEDNDGDGSVDFPADAGCWSPLDGSEEPSPPTLLLHACSDGIDNDGDRLVDLADTGCRGPWDPSERTLPL